MPATPSTTDLRAALSKTLHSAAFGKFMTQAIAQAIEETADKPGQIVLSPMGTTKRFREHPSYQGACALDIEDDAGNELSLIRAYERPTHSTDAHYWHPAHWRVHAKRNDANGVSWHAYLGTFVTDDFGTLVEVAR